MLVGQTINHSRGHDHLDQRAVQHREDRYTADQPGRAASGAFIDIGQWRATLRQFGRRHGQHGNCRHQQIEHDGDGQGQQDRRRHGMGDVFGFLGHIDQILESQEGVKGQHRPRRDADPGEALEGRNQLRPARWQVGQAALRRPDDQQQSADFQHRENGGRGHRFADSPQRQSGQQGQYQDHAQRLGQGHEFMQIADRAVDDSGRRHHPRQRHHQPDDQRQPARAESLAHIDRLAGAARIARHQFGETEGGEGGQQGGDQEGYRRRHARAPRHLADQHEDAGPDGGAQPVEDQQR